MSVKQLVVLDGKKGELGRTSREVGKKVEFSAEKSMAALKSHSEAERRRRDRINAHLETLRSLVPNRKKMDKATLLAEVISQVKQLEKTVTEASQGMNIPMYRNEANVEKLDNSATDGSFLVRVSLCCEHKPDILSDVRKTLKDLSVKLLKSEISTSGGRIKCVFLITSSDELILSFLRSALGNILDKVSALAEFDQELVYPRKRPRVSHFDSSCSSS